MEQWRQGARAVLRGMGFSVLFGLATLGASSLVPRVLPQPWGMLAFFAFGAAVRAWPLVRKGSWWEEAWAYGVVILRIGATGWTPTRSPSRRRTAVIFGLPYRPPTSA